MKPIKFAIVILIGIGLVQGGAVRMLSEANNNNNKDNEELEAAGGDKIKLPSPRLDSSISVEKALSKRRSVRAYKNEALSLGEVSQLLWAAQGITDKARGLRTAPSAGALYPLEVYIITGSVMSVDQAFYKYEPAEHALIKVKNGDLRPQLMAAALGQTPVRDAALVIAITAVYERTMQKYGERGRRYVWLEAGHAAQNLYLQAVALNLGLVVIGAFDDEAVKRILSLAEREFPLYLIPVGRI